MIERTLQTLNEIAPQAVAALGHDVDLLHEAPEATFLIHHGADRTRAIRIPSRVRQLVEVARRGADDVVRILRVSAPEKPTVVRTVARCGEEGDWFLVRPALGTVEAITVRDARARVDAVPDPIFITERVRAGVRSEIYRGPVRAEADDALAATRPARRPQADAATLAAGATD